MICNSLSTCISVIILCKLTQLWSAEFTNAAWTFVSQSRSTLGSSTLCCPTEKMSALKWVAPLSLHLQSQLHVACLLPPHSQYHYITELLCKMGWVKPMGSYRHRFSFSAHRKLSLSIQNKNIERTQVEMAERMSTDSNTLRHPKKSCFKVLQIPPLAVSSTPHSHSVIWKTAHSYLKKPLTL